MELTAQQIAQILKGTVEGDETVRITKFAKIEHGKTGAISFYANPKYEKYVYTCRSSAIIVNKDFVPSSPVKTPALIRVDSAYAGVAELLRYVSQQKRRKGFHRSLRSHYYLTTKFGKRVYVGAFACVGHHTSVGDDTVISEHVHIGDNCTIGSGCIFYPGVRIYPGTIIGNNVIVHANAVIGSDGFGNVPQADGTWKKIEHLGNVVIGNDVEIGANTTIDRSEIESTIIGNGVKIDNLCQIAHNVIIGDNTVMAAQVGIAGSAKIGKNCILAGQVGISGHITIADNTTIGPQAGVIGNIKTSGGTWLGSPIINAKTYMKAYAIFKRAAEQ